MPPTNQTALITGASAGLGYEFAHLFARDHYNLVLVARSGPKLAELADQLRQQHSIQVKTIPLDLGLPQLGGCELARLLRQAMAEMPGIKTRLVALTGYSDREMRERAGAAGFDAYVVKPIMPEALEALLGA